jgi:hypothetical protein
MTEWQPIESAPKDGSIVVLYCPRGISRQGYGDADPPVTIGHFAVGEYGGPARWLSVESIMEVHDYGGMTGVSTAVEQIDVDPTHWLPLPALPGSSGDRK